MEAQTKSRTILDPRRALRFALLCTAVATGAALAGCEPSDDPMQAPPGTPPDPSMMMMMPMPPDPNTIRLTLGPVSMRSGEERTVCVTRRLSLPSATNIVKIATRQKFSHHVIIYRHTSGTPTLNDTPKNCPPLNLLAGGSIKVPMFIGESADDNQNQIQLPPGIAYHLQGNDYYTIEAHLLNATPSEATADAEVQLTPADPGAKVTYADMLFFSNQRAIDKSYDGKSAGLPPGKQTTIDPAFSTVAEGLNVFGITTHQHRLGKSVVVAKSTAADKPGTELFTNTNWSHPELFRLPDDKPLTFQKGEGLRWVCSYDNTSTRYVRFGQSAETDEMCIIWGYYYPAIGLQIYWN